MTNVFATTVIPEDLLWVGWGREATNGTVVAPTMTMPFDKGKGVPHDMPTMLMDEGVRGVMGNDFGMVTGTEIADFPISGDVYLDSIGHPLLNIFGGYQTTGSTPSNSTTPTGPLTAGATTFSLTSATGYSATSIAMISGGGAGAPSEVVQFSALAGVAVTLATPLRFNHAASATIQTVVAPFTHNFSILNGNGTFGENVDAQPATHTLTWWNNLSASTKARQYAYWCASGIDFKLNSEQLFQHDTKGTAVLGVVAQSGPTNTQPAALSIADWQFAASIGGSAVNNITDATINITRTLKPDFGLNGQQAPYVIARLGLSISGKLTFIAVDETPLTAMLNATQQALQISMSSANEGFTFKCTKAQYKTVTNQAPDLLMYEVEFTGIFNNTDIGSTGGLGPGTVQLINSTPTY